MIKASARPQTFFAGLALLLLLALYVVALQVFFTTRFPGANDFYSRWRGAQVFWQEGLNPYSAEATLAIQEGIYGRPALPDEDPGPFAYPFYTVFLLIPLVPLTYSWASAVWLAVVQAALVGGTLLALRLYRWRQPPWLLALTLLWTLIFYHSARTILLGQFAGVVYFLLILCLWALQARREALAGLALALSTVKPQMAFLLIPALLLWAVFNRRWRFIAWAGGAMAVLLAVSFALQPTWLADFVGQLARYPSYTAIGSPVWVVTHYYLPQLDTPGELALSALAVGWMLYAWGRGLRPGHGPADGAFHWAIAVTLVVTNLVALRTATTNYVMMYPALFLGLKLWATGRGGRRWVAAFYALSFVAMWTLFLTTVVERFEHPVVYLPLPFGLAVLLILARSGLERAAVTPLEPDPR
ncbi:MAG: glycosyltransferase family 87 protein [Anaerolineae bacterium]